MTEAGRKEWLNPAAVPAYIHAMKKALIVIAALVLIIVVLAGTAYFFTFAGRQPITDGFTLNGVRVVKDGFVSLGMVDVGQGEVALIDAGNDRAGKAILAELARRQLGPEAVRAILLTHGHPDHMAAAPLFPRAEVMALEEDVALAEGRAAGKGPVQRFFPVKPTGIKIARVLHDGETVNLGGVAFRVFATPGHTAGSAAYLVNGVLFLGDAADAKDHGRIVPGPWLFGENGEQGRASLVRLAKRLAQDGEKVEVIVFAHSGVLTSGLAPLSAFGG